MAIAASKVLSSTKLSLYAPAFVSSSSTRCLIAGGAGAFGAGAAASGATAFGAGAGFVFFAAAFLVAAGFFFVDFFAVGIGPPDTSAVSITVCWVFGFDTNHRCPIELFSLSPHPPGSGFRLWVVSSGFSGPGGAFLCV